MDIVKLDAVQLYNNQRSNMGVGFVGPLSCLGKVYQYTTVYHHLVYKQLPKNIKNYLSLSLHSVHTEVELVPDWITFCEPA